MSQTTTGSTSRVWTFTLVLDGVSELTDAVTDALYQAGCDDALVGSRDGVAFLDFDREADSFQDAVLSAIASVESSSIGVRVIRIEPDELVTMAEIARRTQRSRESIRQLASGQRGPGGFPPPIANISQKSPIWRWYEVRHWIELMEKQTPQDLEVEDEESVDGLIAIINATLEVRRHVLLKDKAVALFHTFLNPQLPEPKPRKTRVKNSSTAERDPG